RADIAESKPLQGRERDPRMPANLAHRYPTVRGIRCDVAVPDLAEPLTPGLLALGEELPIRFSVVLGVDLADEVQRVHPPTAPVTDQRVDAEHHRLVNPRELRPPSLAVRVPGTKEERVRLPFVQRSDILRRRRPQRLATLAVVEAHTVNLAVTEVRVGVPVREVQ